ncbi:hypothetical protein ACFLV3_07170 [Chloroflexota bacterium]
MRKLPLIDLTILIAGLVVIIAGCGPRVSSTAEPPSPSDVRTDSAVRLTFITQPVGDIAGSAFDTEPVVAAEDAEGNIVTSYRGLVALTITPGTGGSKARLFGGTTVRLVNGVVEFRDLHIDKSGAGYTLTATSNTLVPATSTPFTILPGAPAKLSFTTQPSNGVAGSPLTIQPELTVQDRYGNMASSYEGSVVLSATITYVSQETSETWWGVISGTTTVPLVNSIARFTDISADLAIPGYKLIAESEGLGSASSKYFTISPAAPAKLEFTVQPEGALAETPFETQPKVAIEDVYGNVVNSSRASVTLSIAPGTGTAGAILSGTETLIAEGGLGGLAVFTNLSIDQAGSDYMLKATSKGITSTISQAFNVSAP